MTKSMTTDNGRGICGRNFFSILIAIAFLALAVSGVVLFLVPPGRVANWTDWRLAGLSKDQWQSLHICFAVVFAVGSVVHIYLNWRTLVCYFTSRATGRLSFRWEWALAIGLCAVVGFGTVLGLPPFSSFMAFHESVKHSWDAQERRPPIPHAELLTLSELAVEAGIPLETMQANLAAAGVDASDETATVGDLARQNELSPEGLYRLGSGERGGGPGKGGSAHGAGGGGRGFGRLTLAEYCAEQGIAIEHALEKLRAAGLEAAPDRTLRDIADAGGLHPRRVREIVDAP